MSARDEGAALPTVTFLARRPFEAQFSVDEYFARVRDDLERLGVRTEWSGAPAPSKGLVNRLRILLSVAARRRDLLHVTGDITFAAAVARGPVVVTFHDCEILGRLSPLRRELVRLLWFDLPARRADLITAISQATKRRLCEVLPRLDPARVRVVPVSVSEMFEAKPADFDGRRPRILQVGTKQNKNVPRLIRALRGLSCHLSIIGPMTREIERELARCGVSHDNRTGLSKREVVAAYEACDILTLVSTEEGFGMPIVEAQRVGRVVVTSDCSSMPEVAGGAAHLVDPASEADIRRGIERVIADDAYRADLVQRGYANARRFERLAIARTYKALYEELIAGRAERLIPRECE